MRRWALWGAISTFGFFSGTIVTPPILSTMVELLDLEISEYVYLYQISTYIIPIAALPTAWLVKRFGVRKAYFTCLLLATLRNGSRALLFLPNEDEWQYLRYFYLVLTVVTDKLVVLLYYCLPLKVAEMWFSGKSERSFAWSSILVMPTLGSSIASIVLPYVIYSVADIWQLGYFNLIALLLSGMALIFGLTVASDPLIATKGEILNERQQQAAEVDKQPLIVGLKSLVLNKHLMLHMVVRCLFDCAGFLIIELLQDILGAVGFSRQFCGYLLAGMMINQAIGQMASSFLVEDRSGEKGYVKKCKVYVSIQLVTFILYGCSLIAQFPHHDWLHGYLLIGSAIIFTSCHAWIMPSMNNLLGQMVAGSTPAATMCAMLCISEFVLTNFLTFTFVGLRQAGSEILSATYLSSMVFLLSVATLVSVAYVIFFRSTKQEVTSSQVSGDYCMEKKDMFREGNKC